MLSFPIVTVIFIFIWIFSLDSFFQYIFFFLTKIWFFFSFVNFLSRRSMFSLPFTPNWFLKCIPHFLPYTDRVARLTGDYRLFLRDRNTFSRVLYFFFSLLSLDFCHFSIFLFIYVYFYYRKEKPNCWPC